VRLSCLQLPEGFSDVFQPPLDLATLAMYEATDSIVLGLECLEESVAEDPLGGSALTGDRCCFAGARGRLVLYEIFEEIVVDINCGAD